MPRGGWKEYFVFSKKERVAVFILLAVMAVFISISYFYTPIFNSPVIDKDVQAKLNALSVSRQSAGVRNAEDNGDSTISPGTPAVAENTPKKEQFYFDPNTLTAEGWKKLGFRDKTIENIFKYRDEVGKFKTPDDLYKVPRIRRKTVEAVLPFVRIGLPASATSSIQLAKTADMPAAGVKNPIYKIINVNNATADDFMVFPGMTDAVANRIVKFRTSINGFTSVDDVAKTYGLHDSTFKIMRPYLTISRK